MLSAVEPTNTRPEVESAAGAMPAPRHAKRSFAAYPTILSEGTNLPEETGMSPPEAMNLRPGKPLVPEMAMKAWAAVTRDHISLKQNIKSIDISHSPWIPQVQSAEQNSIPIRVARQRALARPPTCTVNRWLPGLPATVLSSVPPMMRFSYHCPRRCGRGICRSG